MSDTTHTNGRIKLKFIKKKKKKKNSRDKV